LDAVLARETPLAHAAAVKDYKQCLALVWSVSQATALTGAYDRRLGGWVISWHGLHTQGFMPFMRPSG